MDGSRNRSPHSNEPLSYHPDTVRSLPAFLGVRPTLNPHPTGLFVIKSGPLNWVKPNEWALEDSNLEPCHSVDNRSELAFNRLRGAD